SAMNAEKGGAALLRPGCFQLKLINNNANTSQQDLEILLCQRTTYTEVGFFPSLELSPRPFNSDHYYVVSLT
ncbi:hypothetical protein KUCAC02_034581, partial [Chaenocephalus aceratus]